jgi:HD superfamily phosphohydrolase YqeK
MTNNEIIIRLHDLARSLDSKELREIADRFSDLAKQVERNEA